MASINLKLNTFRATKEDTYPLVFIIRHKGSHAHIPTGIYLDKNSWDDKKGIKKGTKTVLDPIRANIQLQISKTNLQTFILELTNSRAIDNLTASEIKKKYLDKNIKEKYNLNTYYDYFMTTRSISTARIYKSSLVVLVKYFQQSISFSDITPKFLRDFEVWLTSNGSSINNTGLHMRNIRAVFNSAIDDDVIELNLYPFRKYKIKSEETIKRNLTIDEIKKLRETELPGIPGLSRDVFMLIYYLIGINLKDLCYLTKENITDGRIEYKRHKGGKHYSVKLEPEAKALFKKLRGSKYLVNLLEHYAEYDSVKKEINKKLKVAAKKAKINKPLTTYYARHSWATVAGVLDIPKETISAALGHSIGSKITNIYIDFDRNKVDAANQKVLKSIK